MIIGIIQARIGSTRLPGKVLKPILGKPMLQHMVERLQHAKLLDKIIIATGNTEENKPIITFCQENHIECFAGSEQDVLDRFYQAAKKFNADIIVRMTGDCPLIDPVFVDNLIRFYHQNKPLHFARLAVGQTFPDGLNAELFPFATLETCWKETMERKHREHVTLFIKENPSRFKINTLHHSTDLSFHRWCVDTPEDFEFVTQVYNHLYSKEHIFGMEHILTLLSQKPELLTINKHIQPSEDTRHSFEIQRTGT